MLVVWIFWQEKELQYLTQNQLNFIIFYNSYSDHFADRKTDLDRLSDLPKITEGASLSRTWILVVALTHYSSLSLVNYNISWHSDELNSISVDKFLTKKHAEALCEDSNIWTVVPVRKELKL